MLNGENRRLAVPGVKDLSAHGAGYYGGENENKRYILAG